jgi:hypothetical protein
MNAPALIEPTLDALAAEINAAHTEAQAFSSQAVERAHDAGIRLNQAKAQCQHGDWLPWLAEHCPAVSERTARAYMQLARDWKALETKTAVTADLTLDAALKLLSAPKAVKKPAQKRLPAMPAKTAVTADLTKPEPLRPASKPGAFEAALALGPLAQFDAAINAPSEPEPTLDLGFLNIPPDVSSEGNPPALDAVLNKLSSNDRETLEGYLRDALNDRLQVERSALQTIRTEIEVEKERIKKNSQGLTAFMTKEEFRLVRGLLHPDRHPDDVDRYRRATEVINRMEAAINPNIPVAVLRKRGWADAAQAKRRQPNQEAQL